VLPKTYEAATLRYAQARVELWTIDEHRVGLKPILRKVWAKRGKRPVAVIRPQYKWLWVVAFVCPESGETSWWLIPAALTALTFSRLLQAFAQERGAGTDSRILLVLDNAGWHTGGDVVAPEGVELIPLPPYSPELQPAEHLWALCDAVLVNRSFDTLDALQAVLSPHLVRLTERIAEIRSLTLVHWWPTASTPPPI
jgi:transposase